MIEVLYNPGAGREADVMLEKLKGWYDEKSLRFTDVTKMRDMAPLYDLAAEDCIIVAGGDGTLSRFVNDVEVKKLHCGVKCYPIGSGNDFAKDCGRERGCEPFEVKEALCDLPVLCVNGETRRFINGAGVGLDGFVCKMGNEMHKRTGKPVNYTAMAIKCLFLFKPVHASVTVDGVKTEYDKVWMAPTMHGSYFGGGMRVAPEQDRANGKGTATSVVYCGASKLTTMRILPTIFAGKHVRFKKYVILRQGSEVTVELSCPCDMQVDGEIIENVTVYTVRSAPAGR